MTDVIDKVSQNKLEKWYWNAYVNVVEGYLEIRA